MADGLLSYGGEYINHNGYFVGYITGSNITATWEPDIIIHRVNVNGPNTNYLGVSYPDNVVGSVTAAYSNAVSGYKMFLKTDSRLDVGTKTGSISSITGTDPKFPTDYSGTITTFSYPDNRAGNEYYMGIKINANKPVDITTHYVSNDITPSEVIRYNVPNASSIAWAMNKSDYSAVRNVYAPNATDAEGWLAVSGEDFVGGAVRELENIYIPKATASGRYAPYRAYCYSGLNVIKNVNMPLEEFGEDSVLNAFSISASVDGLTAKNVKLYTSGTCQNISATSGYVYQQPPNIVENVSNIKIPNGSVTVVQSTDVGNITAKSITIVSADTVHDVSGFKDNNYPQFITQLVNNRYVYNVTGAQIIGCEEVHDSKNLAMIVPTNTNPVVYDSTVDATSTNNGQIVNSTLINCSGTANTARYTNLTNFSGRIGSAYNCTGSDVTLNTTIISSCNLGGDVTAGSAIMSYVENLHGYTVTDSTFLYDVSGDKATGRLLVARAIFNEIDAERIDLSGWLTCDNIKVTTTITNQGPGYIQGKDLSASTVSLKGVTLEEGMNITGNQVTISSCPANNVSVTGKTVNIYGAEGISNISASDSLYISGFDSIGNFTISALTANVGQRLSNVNVTGSGFADISGVGFVDGITGQRLSISGGNVSNISAGSARFYSAAGNKITAASAYVDVNSNVMITANSGINAGSGIMTIKTSAYNNTLGNRYALDFSNAKAALNTKHLTQFSARGNDLPAMLITLSGYGRNYFSPSGNFNFNDSNVKTSGTTSLAHCRNMSESGTLDLSHINFIDDPTKNTKLSVAQPLYGTILYPLSAKSWLANKITPSSSEGTKLYTVKWV